MVNPSPRNAVSNPIHHVLLPIAAIFLVSRLLLLLLAYVAQTHFGSHVPYSGWTSLLCRWDCGWYLGIADQGYSTVQTTEAGATNYAFFPLLPVATRTIAPVFGGNLLYAALAFTNAC